MWVMYELSPLRALLPAWSEMGFPEEAVSAKQHLEERTALLSPTCGAVLGSEHLITSSHRHTEGALGEKQPQRRRRSWMYEERRRSWIRGAL